jgi:dTDP-4-amino-4,6-dideoxygalactose transaminase
MSGTFGDFGIFSFHSHKNISTLGEGGMLLVKDDAIANEIPKLRHNGHCSFDYERDDYWKPAMGNLDMPSINGEYLMPNNFCIGEIQCALGVELLKRVDQINAKKRQRAIYFIDTLKKYEFIEFNRVNDLSHNYHLLAGSFNKKNYQNKFISSMAYDEGIQCVVQYMPLNRYSLYQKLGYGKSNCPNADKFFDNMVSFPFQQTLSDNDFQNIIESTIKIFKKNGF